MDRISVSSAQCRLFETRCSWPLGRMPGHKIAGSSIAKRYVNMKTGHAVTGALASAIVFASVGCMRFGQPKSAGNYLDDKVQAAGVTDALAGGPGHDFEGVTVTAYKGIVHLRGRVKSLDDKQRAEKVAKAVVGVRSVKNDIQVRPPTPGL
jgi:hyperosmotically inducible periplasmic protein